MCPDNVYLSRPPMFPRDRTESFFFTGFILSLLASEMKSYQSPLKPIELEINNSRPRSFYQNFLPPSAE